MPESAVSAPFTHSMPLTLPAHPTPVREYRVVVQVESLLGNWVSENTSTFHFRQTYLGPTVRGPRYEVVLLSFTQTNEAGTYALAADVARLKSRLVLELDVTGRLCGVANGDELQAGYAALAPFLHRKYQDSELLTPATLAAVGEVLADEARLVQALVDSVEYGLLLPALFGQAYEPEFAEQPSRSLPRLLLGALDLPLRLAARRLPAPAGAAHAVLVQGWLDEARYSAEDLRQAARGLSGHYDADAPLQASHVESYELSAPGELLHAARLTTAAVPGIFFTKTVATLQALAPPA
jgi:hypothetical protein